MESKRLHFLTHGMSKTCRSLFTNEAIVELRPNSKTYQLTFTFHLPAVDQQTVGAVLKQFER